MRFTLAAVLLAALFLTGTSLQAQDTKTTVLPSVQLRNVAGEMVNTATLSTDSTPVVVSFWATWCKPCIMELTTYAPLFEEWHKETGVKIIAVSIDDSRNALKVAPLVKARNWPFDVLLDENQNFKRAMNVNNVPHTFLIQNGKIVWSHAAFAAGDEEDLYEQIKKLVAKK
jgi:thiol-disulfide isomerase/thioredoxin